MVVEENEDDDEDEEEWWRRMMMKRRMRKRRANSRVLLYPSLPTHEFVVYPAKCARQLEVQTARGLKCINLGTYIHTYIRFNEFRMLRICRFLFFFFLELDKRDKL